MEVFDSLRSDEATALGRFDSHLEKVHIRTGIYQNFDDIPSVSSGSGFFEDAEADCEESEQHFALTLILVGKVRKEEDVAVI